MQFTKYINGFMLLIFLVACSSSIIAAVVVEKKCGKYFFQIKILNGLEYGETKFKLYCKDEGNKEKLFYKTDSVMYISAMCVKNAEKQDLMLFQESYGGNVAPEDMFGVFDPQTKKMLITPSDWPNGNEKQVQELIGFPPPYGGGKDDRFFFCCFSEQYKEDISH